MYELRQIQFGERPVSSTEHKSKIDNFFAKHLQVHEAKLESGKENIPANVENVDEIRPETVVVEIQGLVEQQRVSNVLGTAFRRRLENIIRGTISNVSRTPRPSPQPRTPRGNTPQPSSHSTQAGTPERVSRDGTPQASQNNTSSPVLSNTSRDGTSTLVPTQNILPQDRTVPDVPYRPRSVEQLQAAAERSRSNSVDSLRSRSSASCKSF